MNKKYYVYMLRCRDQSLYTGYTVDMDARLTKHSAGLASKYTRSRLPVALVYLEEHPDKISATKREFEIKQFSKAKKEALIKDFPLYEPISSSYTILESDNPWNVE